MVKIVGSGHTSSSWQPPSYAMYFRRNLQRDETDNFTRLAQNYKMFTERLRPAALKFTRQMKRRPFINDFHCQLKRFGDNLNLEITKWTLVTDCALTTEIHSHRSCIMILRPLSNQNYVTLNFSPQGFRFTFYVFIRNRSTFPRTGWPRILKSYHPRPLDAYHSWFESLFSRQRASTVQRAGWRQPSWMS